MKVKKIILEIIAIAIVIGIAFLILVGGKTKNTIRHDYFIKGSITFNKNHVVNNKISENGMDFPVPTLNLYDYR